MLYKSITWWPGAYHVFSEGKRIGVVNLHLVRTGGKPYEAWAAHNHNFLSIQGQFRSRTVAAEAILTGKPVAINDVG